MPEFVDLLSKIHLQWIERLDLNKKSQMYSRCST